jgi:hypothetical protein
MDCAVEHDADQAVGDDESSWATVGQGLAGADKQAGTYGASNGNHLQMAALEPAGQRRAGRVCGGLLDVERLAIGGVPGLWGEGDGWVALEAVEDAQGDAATVGRAFAVGIVVGVLRSSPKALLGSIHVVVDGHGEAGGGAVTASGRCEAARRRGDEAGAKVVVCLQDRGSLWA